MWVGESGPDGGTAPSEKVLTGLERGEGRLPM